MQRLMLNISLALSLSLAACATAQPPQQLVDARAAYRHAAASSANQHAPTHLESARRALIRAEQSFGDSPRSEETVDLAYIAQRLAQLAEVQSEIAVAQNDRGIAERELQVAEQKKAHETEHQLTETQQELAKVETEAAMQPKIDREKAKLDDAHKDLERERQARKDAERSASEAKDALAKIAAVKEDARGTIITIPGNVLFTSGKSNLMPGSGEKLDAVVDALRSMRGQKVTVEGYTDSTGSPGVNQRLSEKRAAAVKDYMIRHGIPSDQIEARGMGSDNPVDDNSTAEGRAGNRRVEIILERATS